MDLIRAGLQDLDKARALFDQLKADDIPDERCAELLSALAHACDPDMALSNFVDISSTRCNPANAIWNTSSPTTTP